MFVGAATAAAAAAALFAWWRRRDRIPPALSYGTAGFRAPHWLLDVAMERVGMVAALRSRSSGGIATGVMVTASHNPIRDNGCKIVDGDGGMLAMEWEGRAERVARCRESELEAVIDSFQAPPMRGVVVVGHDTRPHSARLARLVKRGIERCGCDVVDVGMVTTPHLHHCVASHNQGLMGGYFENLLEEAAGKKEEEVLWVDCAGGVGAMTVNRLSGGTRLRAFNQPGQVELNAFCGAEYVQKEKKAPLNDVVGKKCCSIDGDADRLVYYYHRENSEFRVLDGDKIAALCTTFLKEELPAHHKIGVVQTAYANGASTAYLRSLKDVQVVVTKTGVKHLHHAALDFDVGVYFEANGHGTILFNNATVSSALSKLANQYVGDAVADALLVEKILERKNWSLEDWDSIYEDLPSKQIKVAVQDRTKLKPNHNETRLVEPKSLQDAIDSLVRQVDGGRAFVRPSGTEDVVRIYAEAPTQALADQLALDCKLAVQRCETQ